MSCSPRLPQYSARPNSTTRRWGLITSLRNAWFGHTTLTWPEASCTSAVKSLKPGRRVPVRPQCSTSPEHGRRQAGLEAADRLEAAAVLVAARKAEQQVLDRPQSGLLEVGGAARADALDELERKLEGIVGQRRGYWTTVASSARMSTRSIAAGRMNDSSSLTPSGFSGERV